MTRGQHRSESDEWILPKQPRTRQSQVGEHRRLKLIDRSLILLLMTVGALAVLGCQGPADVTGLEPALGGTRQATGEPTPSDVPSATSTPTPKPVPTTPVPSTQTHTPEPEATSTPTPVSPTAASSSPHLVVAPVVGSLAPGLSLPDLDGNEVSLSDLRGKLVLLNFWTTW